MNISAFITGIVLIVFGIFLISIEVLNIGDKGILSFFDLYGLIALGIGFYMIFNMNKEDKIEKIKTHKKSK